MILLLTRVMSSPAGPEKSSEQSSQHAAGRIIGPGCTGISAVNRMPLSRSCPMIGADGVTLDVREVSRMHRPISSAALRVSLPGRGCLYGSCCMISLQDVEDPSRFQVAFAHAATGVGP